MNSSAILSTMSDISGHLSGGIGDVINCIASEHSVKISGNPPQTVYGEKEHPANRTQLIVIVFTLVRSEYQSGGYYSCTYRVTELQGV